MTAPSTQLTTFDALNGWADDDHAAALAVFRNTCPDMRGDDWQSLCALAENEVRNPSDARAFFEMFFQPVIIGDPAEALFTGYFEPELDGSRRRTARYNVPLHRAPDELTTDRPWATRAEIEEQNLLKDKGLEIVWLADPVDKFFLQVQGSGRVRLADGGVVRVGYGGRNGHDYRSIGRELIRRGAFQAHEASAQRIRAWVADNPEEGRLLLHHNPSYVFFREVSEVPAHKGPLGAMNRSITEKRTIAVDPAYVRLGAPVWIEKAGADPMRRLMIAQDTGSAIKGPQRADIFYGTGDGAGQEAGRIKDPGRMVVLLPIDRAHAEATGG